MASIKKNNLMSCIAYLGFFTALAAVNYNIVIPAVDGDARIWFAVASAGFLALGLISFWGLARGYGQGKTSRKALLTRARTGEPPTGDGTIVVTGKVRALSEALVSPLSNTPCAGYMYRMYYYGRDSRNRRTEIPVYWGYGFRPFALDAQFRARVMAVPVLSIKPQACQGDEVLARARAFVGSTSFEEVPFGSIGGLGSVFALSRELFTNEEGEAVGNWHREGDGRDPSELMLEETVLPLEAQASAIGTWSAEKNGVTAEQSATGNIGVSIVLGPPENLTAKEGLPHSLTSYLVSAALFTSIGAGILWFAVRIFPTLH